MCGIANSIGDPRPHLVPAPELEQATLVQDEHHVELAQRAQTMRDDDHNRLSRARVLDCARQCCFALSVEVCIGFIEHNEKRTTIECSGKTDALALARR